MKTPMQELIEWLDKYGDNRLYGGRELTVHEIKNQARQMIEKEKEVIIDAFISGDNSDCLQEQDSKLFAEQYYNEIFNTNEK